MPLAERSMAFLVSSSLSDIIQFDKRIVPQNRSFKILCYCFFLGWLYRRKKLECAHCGHILVKEITKSLFGKSCLSVYLGSLSVKQVYLVIPYCVRNELCEAECLFTWSRISSKRELGVVGKPK